MSEKIEVEKIFASCKTIFKVGLKLDWYPLRYSIKFKLGQMLHGQKLYTQMLNTNVPKTVDNSHRWPNYRVWLKWHWYQLRYSIIFKLGQMLHGQMLRVKMSPIQLTTHTDGLYIQP